MCKTGEASSKVVPPTVQQVTGRQVEDLYDNLYLLSMFKKPYLCICLIGKGRQ